MKLGRWLDEAAREKHGKIMKDAEELFERALEDAADAEQ